MPERQYEPLESWHIDWLRNYVKRNSDPYPGTRDARLWGRFLATLDEQQAEIDRLTGIQPEETDGTAEATHDQPGSVEQPESAPHNTPTFTIEPT